MLEYELAVSMAVCWMSPGHDWLDNLACKLHCTVLSARCVRQVHNSQPHPISLVSSTSCLIRCCTTSQTRELLASLPASLVSLWLSSADYVKVRSKMQLCAGIRGGGALPML